MHIDKVGFYGIIVLCTKHETTKWKDNKNV